MLCMPWMAAKRCTGLERKPMFDSQAFSIISLQINIKRYVVLFVVISAIQYTCKTLINDEMRIFRYLRIVKLEPLRNEEK